MKFLYLIITSLLFSGSDLYSSDLAIKEEVRVNRPFSTYLQECADNLWEPTLFFPGVRNFPVDDPRSSSNEFRKKCYTLDIRPEADLCGDIFNARVWDEILDGSLGILHAEMPGVLLFYLDRDCPTDREKKDEFILLQVSKKSKPGSRFFMDARYSRFLPKPNFDTALSFQEAHKMLLKNYEEDKAFFPMFSYEQNDEQATRYLSQLLMKKEGKVVTILKNQWSKDYQDIFEEKNTKEGLLSLDKLYGLQKHFMVMFTKKERETIFGKYDDLLGKFGFYRHILKDTREAQDEYEDFIKIGEKSFFYNNMTFLDTYAICIKR